MDYQNETNTLTDWLEWFKKIVNQQISSGGSCELNELLTPNPEPDIPAFKEDPLHTIFLENGLNASQKIIVLLSIAPYYIPDYLNYLGADQRKFQLLSLSRGQINGALIPTVETAVFILAGYKPVNRHDYLSYFFGNAFLIRNALIEIPSVSQYDPITSLRLLPGEKVMTELLSEGPDAPQFISTFPAEKLHTEYQWEDLVLPYDTREQINEVREWVEFEKIIKEKELKQTKFKYGCKSLFHGPPGTGKTLTAALLGKRTGKKVYRIDLSAVVSKYIGETEKNLSQVFDRAADEDWILFFDEADALFGKRGKTNNAHDRYANQEVSYLLQRFETYEGLSILASNYIDNIDTAFYRRFDSIVQFKKPEYEERLQLWKNFLPEGYEFEPEVDIEEIAYSVEVTGASIYNIMRRSYMKAVLRGENLIRGQDMLDSLKKEKRKEGKIITG
jgi:hypothetical protein